MKTIKVILMALIGLTMLTLQGCDNSGCTDPDSLNFDPEATEDNGKCDFPNLTVNFSYSVDGQELTKGTTYTINGTAISFSDVQFYVFNPRVAKDGVMEATGETHFISFDNRSIEFEDLTAGHKHMLMFGLGVDSTTNATIQPSDSDLADGAALGPQNPSMHWGWDNGYIFLKMDGMVDTDGDNVPNAGMEFHIGKNINFNTIALEIHTDALEDEVEVTVDVDFAKAFTGIDLSKDYITHTGDFPALANTVINNMKTAFAKK